MSFFSSQPKNRRARRRLKKRTSTDWIDESPTAAPKGKAHPATSKKGEVHQLHAQIGAIESFLARHHQAEVERIQMKRENILPPPDRSSHKKARQKMTNAARRRYLAQRNKTSFRFLLLFCVACGLVWWLLHPGA